MKKVAIFSIKGGVGKTTTAVNLSWLLAHKEAPVYLIDLDPQSSCMQMTCKQEIPMIPLSSWKKLSRKEKRNSLLPLIQDRLLLCPGDQSFRKIESLLDTGQGGRNQFLDLFDLGQKDNGLVIFDCPPGLGRLAEALLRSVDMVIVPLNPTELSMKTMHQLYDFVQEKQIAQKLFVTFFNNVKIRRKAHARFISRPAMPAETRLSTYIPSLVSIEAMPEKQVPVVASARASKVKTAYELLSEQIYGLLNQ